ncbi:hypothetical protein R6Q57_011782 [Mikania cordata]
MSWWDRDFFFGQYSDVSRVAETYQDETGVQSSEATNRPVLPDLNEEVAGQTSYWQFDLNQEPCVDEDVNRECYAGEDDGHHWRGHTWSRLFDMTYPPQYRLLTVEFLSTFVYRPQGPDFQPQPEFASVTGLYTEEETHMPIYTTAIHTADDAVVSAWWPRIGDDPFVRSARDTRIHDSLIRYLHRCIASSITGRGMSQ